jgi:hypothetical protein
MVQITIYVTFFYLFYTGHKKCLFTPKLWWMDIVCSDAYSEYFVWIFNFKKIHLKCTFIIGAFALYAFHLSMLQERQRWMFAIFPSKLLGLCWLLGLHATCPNFDLNYIHIRMKKKKISGPWRCTGIQLVMYILAGCWFGCPKVESKSGVHGWSLDNLFARPQLLFY